MKVEGRTTSLSALEQTAQRIEDLLDEERTVLAERRLPEIEQIVARKSHLALEFDRLLRAAPAPLASGARARVERLSIALAANAALLSRHVKAVEELSGIVTAAITAAADDGTYQGIVPRRGPGG